MAAEQHAGSFAALIVARERDTSVDAREVRALIAAVGEVTNGGR